MSTAWKKPNRAAQSESISQPSYWGKETRRAVENFQISGRRSPDSLIRAYLRVKQAAAIANQRTGKLDNVRASAILQAIEEILDPTTYPRWDSLFPVDIYQSGAGTCLNMNLNEAISIRAMTYIEDLGHSIHPNDHVNASQSTNDTYPTAMRLAILEESSLLLGAVRGLADAFSQLSDANKGKKKSGRTHLQDALPIEISQEFRAWSTALHRAQKWIHISRQSLQEVGIGGSAVGDGATVPLGYGAECVGVLRQLSGEPLRLSDDLAYCMQSQAPVSWYMSALKMLGIEMTRICNDIRIMSSGPINGFAEIEIPEVQAGSSIMAGKVNPSIVEMANQVFMAVQGFEHTAALAAQSGQLELNVMMPIMAASAIEATQIATRAIQTLTQKCVIGIKPRLDVITRQSQSSPQVATYLVPVLGYERTARLVNEALQARLPVLELAVKQGLIDDRLHKEIQKKYLSSPK